MGYLEKAVAIFKEKGLGYTVNMAVSKIMARKIKNYSLLADLFRDKYGLEVGGPSGIFKTRGFIPLYSIIKGVDGCNFSTKTIWEGNIEAGETYVFQDDKKGYQYISEASDLSLIPGSKYDFVISSHCLEHVANPLKAVSEWLRVLKKDGIILIVLPNKEYTFDHNRPVTKIAHLVDDYNANTGEDDLTHLEEVLKLHDLKKDKLAGSFEAFRERGLQNFEKRSLHHHVFDVALLKEIFGFFKVEVLLTHDKTRDLVIVGRKVNNQ
ncbi:MAG: class I SAM-dependent methyltransferase [Ferruginibacter sp.]